MPSAPVAEFDDAVPSTGVLPPATSTMNSRCHGGRAVSLAASSNPARASDESAGGGCCAEPGIAKRSPLTRITAAQALNRRRLMSRPTWRALDVAARVPSWVLHHNGTTGARSLSHKRRRIWLPFRCPLNGPSCPLVPQRPHENESPAVLTYRTE